MKTYFSITAFLLLVLFSTCLFAQMPGIEWVTIYEEPDVSQPCHRIYQTSEGGYLAGSATQREGLPDFLMVKLNSHGDTLWTRAIGDPARNESINDFIILPENRCLAVGAVSAGSDVDACVMLINSDGTVDTSGYYDDGYYSASVTEVLMDNDSSFVLCGVVSESSGGPDPYLMGLDLSLNQTWGERHEMPHWQSLYSFEQKIDSGFIAVGYAQDTIDYRNEGLLYVANDDGTYDTLIVYGSDGAVEFNDVKILSDNSCIIVGYISYEPSGARDVLVKKFNPDYSTAWTKTYGGADYEEGECVQLHPDGGFIVGGYCQGDDADMWVLRLDANGDTLWTKTFGTPRNDFVGAIDLTDDGGYIIGGSTQEVDNVYRSDLYIAKLYPDGVGIDDEEYNLPKHHALLGNYPNPFNAKTTLKFQLDKPSDITLTLYDILGRELQTLAAGEYQAGKHSVTFDASNLASGTYLYKLRTESFTDIDKMTLIK